LININKKYRSIFIVENRNLWNNQTTGFDPESDLLLTFDFGLKHDVEQMGAEVYYVDSLCSPSEMQMNNFLASEFFKKWHYDESGNDIFTAEGVPFGFSFRIEIWSEYLYYVRLRANLEKLTKLQYEKIYVAEDAKFVANILSEMEIGFAILDKSYAKKTAYFFDIHQYMHNALRGRNLHNIVRDILVKVFSKSSFYFDVIFSSKNKKKNIYAQIYHPTKKIVDYLKKDASVKVITSSLSKSKGWRTYFSQRLIPINGSHTQFKKQADHLFASFIANRNASLLLNDGTNISAGAYSVIEQQIQPRITEALQILNSVITYIKKQPIDLEIMIANIGLVQTIVDCVLKTNKVPSYLIINGLLCGKFCDEAKYATFINSYSTSIKANYYENADNVFCLGDPRMDDYVNSTKPINLNRVKPTISIGTSGFNNLDLNSYVAVEFDFMFDILSAFQEVQDEGGSFNLIIKVRPNGFIEQYKDFTKEYFPKLNIEIVRTVPIREVLNRTDLYISIYSQTLFEASCIGIPVIYYKKDKEILDAPFDKKSELVTVDTIAGLKQAFYDFKSNHDRYNAFLDKRVMEKYVGLLDGKNLERNLAFIKELLNNKLKA
jgi:hypothetical protein